MLHIRRCLRRSHPMTRRQAKARRKRKVALDTPGWRYLHQPRSTGFSLCSAQEPVEAGLGGDHPAQLGRFVGVSRSEVAIIALIHAPNESVDPAEIENRALVEATFVQIYALRRPA